MRYKREGATRLEEIGDRLRGVGAARGRRGRRGGARVHAHAAADEGVLRGRRRVGLDGHLTDTGDKLESGVAGGQVRCVPWAAPLGPAGRASVPARELGLCGTTFASFLLPLSVGRAGRALLLAWDLWLPDTCARREGEAHGRDETAAAVPRSEGMEGRRKAAAGPRWAAVRVRGRPGQAGSEPLRGHRPGREGSLSGRRRARRRSRSSSARFALGGRRRRRSSGAEEKATWQEPQRAKWIATRVPLPSRTNHRRCSSRLAPPQRTVTGHGRGCRGGSRRGPGAHLAHPPAGTCPPALPSA